MLTKVCSKCGIEKGLNCYHINKTGKFGRHAECKKCKKEKNKKRYNNNKEKFIQYQMQYRQANKEKITEYKKHYRENNKEKVVAYKKQHYEDNRDKILELRKQYRVENKEKISTRRKIHYVTNQEYYKEYNRKYRVENKEKMTEYKKNWYKENKEKVKAGKQRYRARKKALPNTLTKDDWNETLNHFNNACALTGETDNIHLEHFIPISWGHGGSTQENCYPLEGSLNISKGDKNPFEWIQDYPQYTEYFDNLVSYLASQNDMSVEDFKDYVFWCEENKQELQEDNEQLELHLEGLEGETIDNRWY